MNLSANSAAKNILARRSTKNEPARRAPLPRVGWRRRGPPVPAVANGRAKLGAAATRRLVDPASRLAFRIERPRRSRKGSKKTAVEILKSPRVGLGPLCVERETGVEGRCAFEGFLKKMDKTKEEQGDE